MNPLQDSEKLDDGRKESTIRRPVAKYQHYIDHFEELYRQSPLAKVVDKDAHSTPSSKHNTKDAMPGNTSGSFKVPLVSPMLKPKPVLASMGAFIMSPVAQLIQQMQSTGGATKNGSEKESTSTDHVEKSPRESKQNGDRLDFEVNDAVERKQRLGSGGGLADFQPRLGEEVESLKDAEESGAVAEEDTSLFSDVPSVKDVVGEMDAGTKRIPEVGDTEMNSSEAESSDKAMIETSSLGTVSKQREIRRSVRGKDVAVKHNSDVEHGDRGSCDDITKLSKKTVTDLDQWIVKWLGSGLKHVAVEGHRLEDPEGSFWHSTAIFKRISSCLLETSSGSRYRLHGNINKLLAMDQGFSKKFLRRFQKGFPAKWKAYLVEEAVEQSGKKLEGAVAESTDTEPTKTDNTRGINPAKQTKHKTPNTLKKEKGPAEKKTPVTQASNKVPDTTPVTRKREAVAVTPSFVSVNEIRTTKSGRKVLPPLQYWRGQRQRTLLYMDGTAELLEGSIDYTPVSATRPSVKGSIDISQRAKRLYTRKETPSSRRRPGRSKRMTSNRDSSFQESGSEDTLPERTRKTVENAKPESSEDTSKTMKEDSKECSPEALSHGLKQGSLRRSPRMSLDASDHNSRTRSGSANRTGVCVGSEVSSLVSGVDRDTANGSHPYDLYGAVMGVVKQHHQRRKSNQSRRRHSHAASMSSSSPAGHERRENSFNISDDEDFMNESSASATEGREKNSSLSSKGYSVSSRSNGIKLREKRKRSSKANEKVLLGSNMLPSVVLQKYKDNDSNTRMKNVGSSGAGKQDKAERTKGKQTEEAPKSRRSKRIQKSCPQQEENNQSEENSEKWKPDETHRLQRALKMIPPSSKQFWHRVASSVGTRTEWECQQAHQAKLEGTTKASNQSKGTTNGTSKDNKGSNQVAKEPVVLTAAKGTMRRKRQLRELIQQHNQASEEDLFESTPFKKQRKTTVPLLNLDLGEEEEDDDGGMMAKTPGSARLKTPSTRFHNLLAPLSGKKTPHSTALTPGLLYSVERKHMDKYIFGMQKKRAGRRVKKGPEPALNMSPTLKVRPKQSGTRTMAVTPRISEAFHVDPVQDVDSDEGEADYYWSDEENNTVPSKH